MTFESWNPVLTVAWYGNTPSSLMTTPTTWLPATELALVRPVVPGSFRSTQADWPNVPSGLRRTTASAPGAGSVEPLWSESAASV